ncbi:MAG: MCE family protein [Mycobacteriaceae bacterium]
MKHVFTSFKVLINNNFKYFWTGILSCLIIVSLLLGTVLFTQSGVDSKTITADFLQASGVKPGDKVRIAGVDIGTVTRATLQGDHVQIAMQISNSAELGGNSKAAIRLSTILGTRYIELKPEGTGSLLNNHISLTNSSVPFDLSQLIDTGTPVLEDIDSNSLRNSLDALSAQFRDTPTLVPEALTSISRLSDVINTRKEQVNNLIKEAAAVSAILNQNVNAIGILVRQGQQLAQKLNREQMIITQALTTINSLSNELRGLFTEDSGQLTELITQLDLLNAGLVNTNSKISLAFETFTVFARQMANANGNGNYMDAFLGSSIVPDSLLCRLALIGPCQ